MNKVLVVVDMQNDFIDGSLANPMAQVIVNDVAKYVASFDGLIVFTRDTHEENYLETREGKNLPVPHCIALTDGCDVYGCDFVFGIAHMCPILEDKGRYIANMFAQYHYLPRGVNHTDYNRFRSCCQQLKNLIPAELVGKEFTIGFPDHIGCGLGGGDWNTVKKIIEEEFTGDEWKVEIWKLN